MKLSTMQVGSILPYLSIKTGISQTLGVVPGFHQEIFFLRDFLNCCLANCRQAVICLLLRRGIHLATLSLRNDQWSAVFWRDGAQQSFQGLCWRGLWILSWIPENGQSFLVTGLDWTPNSHMTFGDFKLFLFHSNRPGNF